MLAVFLLYNLSHIEETGVKQWISRGRFNSSQWGENSKVKLEGGFSKSRLRIHPVQFGSTDIRWRLGGGVTGLGGRSDLASAVVTRGQVMNSKSGIRNTRG